MTALLVLRLKPVPAVRNVRLACLLWIDNHETVFLRELVHTRARGEVIRILFTAVEHDDDRQRLTGVTSGDVRLVLERAGVIGVAAGYESASVAMGVGRRCSCGEPGAVNGVLRQFERRRRYIDDARSALYHSAVRIG